MAATSANSARTMISISPHGSLDNEEAFLLHLSSQAVNSDGTATVTRVGAFGDFILEKHPQISERFPSRKGNAQRAGGASH